MHPPTPLQERDTETMLMLLWLACSPPPKCPEPTPPARVLSESEATLLAPYLADLREGIRTFGDNGFGICQGKRDCEQFLGPEPAPLAAGDYLIRAELQVPELGEDWKVRFKIDCELTTSEGRKTPQTHEKLYDVRHVRNDKKGYQLQPLWMIQSPHPNGARECTYSLTPVSPDGKDGKAWTGKYSTLPPAEAGATADGAAPTTP